MRAHWVIESKFDRPRVHPHQIEKTSVVERLRASELDAILVHAPAGFGKSTVLAQWARALGKSGTRVAWLNLDEEDRRGEQFAAYVAAAVRRALDEPEDAAHVGIHSGLSPARELLTLVGEVARRQRQIGLVLEDYHRAECDEVDALLRGFLERAPPWVRVAISSRSMPKVGIARLKAEGRAAIVTERDLRFNSAETSLFLDAVLPAGAAEWTRFVERAEGWPVALQFARMWLADGGDVAALGVASETGDLGAYLSDQVFSALPSETRDFLLRTSLLEDISAEVAQALGVERAERIARGIARSALPITLLSQEPLRFRCHHLLRDFLLARAHSEGLDIEALHRRMARWFAQRGVLASAVRHALAGDDPRYAAALLDEAGGWRLIYSEQGQLRAILRSVHAVLPDAGAFPRLALGASILAAKAADLNVARALFHSVAGAAAEGAIADDIHLIDALIRLYCDAPLDDASLEALAELGRRAPTQDPIGAALTSNLLAYFSLQTGGYILAKRYAVRAIAQFRQAKAVFGEAHLYAHLGAAELALGNRAAAAQAYGAMRDLCRSALGPDSDLEAIAGVLEAETSYEADDRARARELLGAGLSRIEQADGWFDVFAAGYVTAARLDGVDHGPAAAFDALERGRHTARARDMRRLDRLLAEETVRTATLAGDIERAAAECRHLGFALTRSTEAPEPVSSLRGDGPALLLARLALASGDRRSAGGFLEVAEAQFQRRGAPFTRRISAKLLAAAVRRDEAGDVAAETTAAAVRLALPDRFLRTLFDEASILGDLLDKARAGAGSPAARARRRPTSRCRRASGRFSGCSPPASATRRSPARSRSIPTRSNITSSACS
jgi:LuxR family maltose regulon positive regulatory protein